MGGGYGAVNDVDGEEVGVDSGTSGDEWVLAMGGGW